ncbi:uncharacterized protein CCOS01_04097 [Colletotrichum costaricense]|uniref:Uncharacterized protein n=1 Tax=Colletotrichum costaricense TaxID=1209916 RepID=A0AAJ0E2F0_9PEZI|nr:uncharacterized protein CCOS01_04097 [Colletotrichum costaricense]KAK1532114.1 hypothetical protein CCOS01_04097 [Colletotrichum costaricense]
MAEGLKPGVRETLKSYIFINGKYWVAKDLTLANFVDLVAAETREYDFTTAVQAAYRTTVHEPKPQSEGYADFPSLAEMRPPPMMPAGANVDRKIWDGNNSRKMKKEDEDFMAAAMTDEENDEGPIGHPKYHTNVILNHAPLASMAPWHPSNIQEPEAHQHDRALEAVNNCIIAGQQPQILPGLDDNRFDEHTPHY